MTTNNYQADSIQSLDYFEHIRKYPGMYIGSKDIKGLHHCIKEIVSNSIDEWLNGACSQIIVRLTADGGIYVADNGRGIPHGTHESGCSVLQACFGIANTGGKFNNATGQSGYNTSGGEHGTGGKAVNALSTKMVVTTTRDGKKETVSFSRGQATGNYSITNATGSGVTVLFYPDPEIFETTTVDTEALKKMIQEFSFLCSGLTFIYEDEKTNEKITYYSEKGLSDYLNYLNKGKEFICDPLWFYEEEGTYQVEAAIAYNNSYSSSVKLYTNNIPQEKGTHLTGFKTAWTSVFNTFAREKGWLKEKEDNLTGSDFEEGQILILNFKMIDPVFKGQNKEELSSSEGRSYVQRLTTTALKGIFAAQEKNVKKIFDKAISARKAREAARKAKDAARGEKKKDKGLKAKMQLSNKFIDCISKKPEDRNLLLVEGLSAGSAAVEARNAKTDCIYMLRGKVISPLKTAVEKLLANQEISDIVKVIGGGFGNNFDVSKINFDKIVITTDADSDGADIALLLTTFFYTYMRPLVESGKLYRAVTPLYIARCRGQEYYFYSDKELEDWKKDHKTGYELLRAKG